ncbi:MAG: hypothetical protein WCH39_05905 [Schlesneria sp.]
MACNSEYMNASGYEQEVSRVACLLDELAGKPIDRSWWKGYHPLVYCNSNCDMGDRMVRQLCDALKSCDVTQYSLEMQIWWRDHQAADKARLERELRQTTSDNEREAALAKLTHEERRLLNL